MPFRRFRQLLLAGAAAIVAVLPGQVRAGGPEEESCAVAAAVVERQSSLAPGLLAAIGQVESGRWPWTINAAGQGARFDSRDEAIRAVQALQARGVRSIDVGCFQINLMYHPNAFASLEQAFDPVANALYAVKFLGDLEQRTGSLDGAIGAYHSATRERGDAYRARVMAAWSGAGRQAGSVAPSRGIMIPVAAVAALPVPGRSLPYAPSLGPTPSAMAPMTTATSGGLVWAMASQAMGVRVWAARTPQAQSLPVVVSGLPQRSGARR